VLTKRTLQGVPEQIVGAAVEGAAGDDVVAGLGQVEDGQGDGRRARGQGQGADPAVEFGQTLFQHVGGGVHDPGIDIPHFLESEQIGGMLRGGEIVGTGLVDRHRPGQGGGIGNLSGVQGAGAETVIAVVRHGVPPWVSKDPFEPVNSCGNSKEADREKWYQAQSPKSRTKSWLRTQRPGSIYITEIFLLHRKNR
jgi:hypothetical protein